MICKNCINVNAVNNTIVFQNYEICSYNTSKLKAEEKTMPLYRRIIIKTIDDLHHRC